MVCERKKRTFGQRRIDALCCGGNLLLSIGCTRDGRIADEEKKRLYEFGAFLNRYGESIYGTRAVYLHGDGQWGIVKKENTYYLHAAGGGEIEFGLPGADAERAVCLTGENCKMEFDRGGLRITLPERCSADGADPGGSVPDRARRPS